MSRLFDSNAAAVSLMAPVLTSYVTISLLFLPTRIRCVAVELLSNSSKPIFHPTGDLSGTYRTGGILNLIPPSNCKFATEPVEIRDGVFQHALCDQKKQCWLFDMVQGRDP